MFKVIEVRRMRLQKNTKNSDFCYQHHQYLLLVIVGRVLSLIARLVQVWWLQVRNTVKTASHTHLLRAQSKGGGGWGGRGGEVCGGSSPPKNCCFPQNCSITFQML